LCICECACVVRRLRPMRPVSRIGEVCRQGMRELHRYRHYLGLKWVYRYRCHMRARTMHHASMAVTMAKGRGSEIVYGRGVAVAPTERTV